MVRLGVNTWLWANRFERRHLDCIDKAVEMGAEAIDFSVNDPYTFPVEAVKEKLAGKALEVIVTTAMPTGCNPISPETWERAAALEYMKQLILVADRLDARVVGGVNYAGSGYHSGSPRSRAEVELAAQYLEQAAAFARERGIMIAMEPVKRFESHFLNTAAQALELIELVGADNLKVHLDTFHMNIEEADLPGAIRMCKGKLAHMHLVENNRDTPGKGHIPWKEVFEALRDIQYEGAGCIETFNPQTLEETAPLTYLTRRFANTPEELAMSGLTFLKKVRREVYAEQ